MSHSQDIEFKTLSPMFANSYIGTPWENYGALLSSNPIMDPSNTSGLPMNLNNVQPCVVFTAQPAQNNMLPQNIGQVARPVLLDDKSRTIKKSNTRGQKIHYCSQCSRQFSRKGNLVRHLRSHFGIKNFQCEECDKRFSTKSNLQSHLKMHDRPEASQCMYCGKSFKREAFFNRHMLLHKQNGDTEKRVYVEKAKQAQKQFNIERIEARKKLEAKLKAKTLAADSKKKEVHSDVSIKLKTLIDAASPPTIPDPQSFNPQSFNPLSYNPLSFDLYTNFGLANFGQKSPHFIHQNFDKTISSTFTLGEEDEELEEEELEEEEELVSEEECIYTEDGACKDEPQHTNNFLNVHTSRMLKTEADAPISVNSVDPWSPLFRPFHEI